MPRSRGGSGVVCDSQGPQLLEDRRLWALATVGIGAAPGARPNNVDGMRDVAKPVVGGKLGNPALDFRPFDFDGSSTLPAHHVVVVVLALTEAIASLAVVTAHHVHDARLRQRSKLVIDGGESDILAAVL